MNILGCRGEKMTNGKCSNFSNCKWCYPPNEGSLFSPLMLDQAGEILKLKERIGEFQEAAKKRATEESKQRAELFKQVAVAVVNDLSMTNEVREVVEKDGDICRKVTKSFPGDTLDDRSISLISRITDGIIKAAKKFSEGVE